MTPPTFWSWIKGRYLIWDTSYYSSLELSLCHKYKGLFRKSKKILLDKDGEKGYIKNRENSGQGFFMPNFANFAQLTESPALLAVLSDNRQTR